MQNAEPPRLQDLTDTNGGPWQHLSNIDGDSISEMWNDSLMLMGERHLPHVKPATLRGRVQAHRDAQPDRRTRSDSSLDDLMLPGGRVYPHPNLGTYIGMADVTEDGPVPDQRAGRKTVHADLILTIVRVSNLPKKDLNGR